MRVDIFIIAEDDQFIEDAITTKFLPVPEISTATLAC